MYFDSFSDLMAMGKHGFYVWTAYGATILVFVGSFLALRAAQRKQLRHLHWQASLRQGAAAEAADSGSLDHGEGTSEP
ncbi:MAG TPA: heme exporter protein CcmD [Gammaproteobacteria bacterium]|nr:MAG: heme exporter protein CcmD [OM182 bacterium]HAL40950.1 heme exporter protein CcmD [Gammaproteobacteria bacterium]|tara:strand:- start:19048 stop:19281 length:234 start_codon:yes stop_codon:yes gene_type:complete